MNANIRRLFQTSERAYLQQLIDIESLSFPTPFGWDSLKEDLDNPNVWIDGLFVSENGQEEFLASYLRLQKFYDEMHIVQIATHPTFRRHGYGKQLLQQALLHTKQAGCTSCFLEVRKSNEAAILLYKRLGFLQIGTRPKYYQDNQEDAFLFAKGIDSLDL